MVYCRSGLDGCSAYAYVLPSNTRKGASIKDIREDITENRAIDIDMKKKYRVSSYRRVGSLERLELEWYRSLMTCFAFRGKVGN
jgi:hypothetical protein